MKAYFKLCGFLKVRANVVDMFTYPVIPNIVCHLLLHKINIVFLDMLFSSLE